MNPARVEIERRRERIQRVNAKRPTITVRAKYRPRAGTLEQLAELVLELLDEQTRSGRR